MTTALDRIRTHLKSANGAASSGQLAQALEEGLTARADAAAQLDRLEREFADQLLDATPAVLQAHQSTLATQQLLVQQLDAAIPRLRERIREAEAREATSAIDAAIARCGERHAAAVPLRKEYEKLARQLARVLEQLGALDAAHASDMEPIRRAERLGDLPAGWGRLPSATDAFGPLAGERQPTYRRDACAVQLPALAGEQPCWGDRGEDREARRRELAERLDRERRERERFVTGYRRTSMQLVDPSRRRAVVQYPGLFHLDTATTPRVRVGDLVTSAGEQWSPESLVDADGWIYHPVRVDPDAVPDGVIVPPPPAEPKAARR